MEIQAQSLLPLLPTFRGKEVAIHPLEGGLTNQNYRLEVGGESYVLRIGSADTHLLGIEREREVTCARAAAAAGIGPDVIAFLPEKQALVTRFVAGRLLTAGDANQPETLHRVAELLRRCHDYPASVDLGVFSPFTTIRNYHALALQRNVPLPKDLDRALVTLSQLETALASDEPPCLCHNDLLLNNFIDDGKAIYLIDWEYAGLGDRFFDLGNLAVNFQLTSERETALLAYYFDEARPDHLRRLRLMRLVSDMRESLWGYLQAGISRLFTPQYYLEYGRRHLDRFQAACLEGAWRCNPKRGS
jgi:thiamine kinase-like enzyme